MAAIGIVINKKMTPTPRKIYLGIILTYIVILLGLRYRVGIDTITYMNAFKHIKTLPAFWHSDIFGQKYEPGYLFVCSLCKTICKEFWFLQMVMATITNTCIFIFLYRNTKNVFAGLILYLFIQWLYFTTEIMRESAAIGIFLLNYRNLENRKWIAYYLISLLSISFHYSAIITWIFPLARFLKPNFYYILLCAGMLIITPLVELLSNLIAIDAISGRIIQYIELESLNLNWRIGELIRTALPAFTTLVAYHLSGKKTQASHMLLLQIMFSIGAFAIPLLFARFTNYTTLFVTISLANLLCSDTPRHWIKVLALSLVLLSQSYYYYSNKAIWFPYVSVFNPKTLREREQIWKQNFIFVY